MGMNRYKVLIAIVLSAALLLFCMPPGSRACGPYFEEAVFTRPDHPDYPLARFAEGMLGVIQPSYARSYLVVAYRYLSGAPLTTAEQQAAAALWNERLSRPEANRDSVIKEWTDARSRFSSTVPEIKSIYRPFDQKDTYGEYLNCAIDSFHTSAATLTRRIDKFGPDSPEVKDWVEAQDAVYSNCSPSGGTIPAMAKSGLPSLIQADRAYQIAAANFYSGNFDTAAQMFKAIAADQSSPWREMAPYLVARALVRKASLSTGPGKYDRDLLGQAESQLISVLGRADLRSVHPAASRLLNFVRIRLHPDERLRELARDLLNQNASGGFKQNLIDFTYLLDKNESDAASGLADAVKKDDITDWILTFQSSDKSALDHSLQRWNASGGLPWLVAAISKVAPASASLPALSAAAAKIKDGSPGFPIIMFHRIRISIGSGQKDGARHLLSGFFSAVTPSLPRSSVNLFLSQRLALAQNLDEFLSNAKRVPAGYALEELTEKPPDTDKAEKALFDRDSAAALNERMPLTMLKEAAASQTLPAHLRRRIAVAAWTRAVLIGDESIAEQLVPILQDLEPDLRQDLQAYLTATNAAARKFAGIFLILRFPGTRPYIVPGVERTEPIGKTDSYRDNWWCPLNLDLNASNYDKMSGMQEPPDATSAKKKPAPGYPAFLSEGERVAAASEWRKLVAIPTAPNYLPGAVLDYARQQPDDPRVPEALSLAVHSTRYGCTDKETVKFSKAAFDLLHKRYPNSEWAKKTKYWFGN
jgi:hypothetical protein